MRAYALIVVMALLAVTASSQSVHRLVITTHGTDRPIAAAKITTTDAVVLTDKDGTVEVESDLFVVSAAGHVTCTCRIYKRTTPVPDAPVPITLPPAVTLRVMVRGCSGRPTPGARVTASLWGPLHRYLSERADLKIPREWQGLTDGNGIAKLIGVPRGIWCDLAASLPHGQTLALRSPLRVVGDQIQKIEIAAPRLAVVQGTVADTIGRPIVGAKVRLFQPPSQAVRNRPRPNKRQSRVLLDCPTELRTDEFGRFTFAGVARGAHSIAVWSKTHGFRRVVHAIYVPGPDAVLPCKITVGAGLAIRGRVLADHGRPLSGINVKYVWSRECAVLTDADGSFALTGFDSDDEEVTIWAEGRGTHCDSGPVKVTPGTNGLVITLMSGAIVAGTVLDDAGRPVNLATVTLYWYADKTKRASTTPTRPPHQPLQTLSRLTKKDGSFGFERLAPGQYTLVAATSREGFAVIENLPLAAGQVRQALRPRLEAGATLELTALRRDAETGETEDRSAYCRFVVRRNKVVVATHSVRWRKAPCLVPAGRLQITAYLFEGYRSPERVVEHEIRVTPGQAAKIRLNWPTDGEDD